jgi:UDP-3-O-[3-hydroxymyristoyl] glucosamine N-acyltransferase
MEFSAKMIAEFLQGEILGDPDVVVSNVAKIEEGKPGTLAFLANPKYSKYLYSTEASIILINKDLKLEQEIKPTLIRVENAYESFASLLQLYEESKPKKKGISELASIHNSASVGEDNYIGEFACISEGAVIGNKVSIYPQVYIGSDVKIGNNTTIFPGVKIYHECVIGDNCVIHAGVVIGSDGFGFAPQSDNHYKKIPQIGNVIIENDVELGANTTIDRATMGSTIIRKGVKLDNLVQVAHNVEIGENTVIVSQTGIAGSAKIGKNCTIAGQVGIVGHLKIGDNVIVAAQSGVSTNIADGSVVLGSPATPISNARKSIAIYRNLPELRTRINEMEKQLTSLKEQLNDK